MLAIAVYFGGGFCGYAVAFALNGFFEVSHSSYLALEFGAMGLWGIFIWARERRTEQRGTEHERHWLHFG